MATSVNIKMYRVGELGDCFLLTFQHEQTTKHMLIDCGSFRNSNDSKLRLRQIAEDIQRKTNGGNLDVVVGTHQHNDHISGFVHAEDIFKQMNIQQVWLSWLDNPRNKQATRIGDNHAKLKKAIVSASEKMASLSKTSTGRQASTPMAKKMAETYHLVNDVMGFFGAAPQLPAQGIQILKDLGKNPTEYLSPGELKHIPGIPESAVRIHVLGPPKDEELLYRKDPRQGESYDHKLHSFYTMANHFLSALSNHANEEDKEEAQFPFNTDYKIPVTESKSFSGDLRQIHALYTAKGNDWRNVDDDWLEQAARLALYMDTFTNNSSLVLAIELVKTGKVLLFAGDAQTGNWLSWQDVKFKDKSTSTDSLLARTALYKVGHHGSHNATLKDAFEKMTNEELVAMIPVDKSDGNITKKNGWKMPAANLYQRLKEKTESRVLRMDDGYADGCNPKKDKHAKMSWDKVGPVKTTPLFIEYIIK